MKSDTYTYNGAEWRKKLEPICPKCGEEHPSIKYEWRSAISEHIRCTCKRCAYQWNTPVLQSANDMKAEQPISDGPPEGRQNLMKLIAIQQKTKNE